MFSLPPLAEVSAALDELLNVGHDWDLTKLNEMSIYMDDITKIKKNNTRPITGEYSFSHKAGLHINAMLKPRVGKFIKSICFNSLNTKLGRHLLSYKKDIHVVAQIHENCWNNNKYLQLKTLLFQKLIILISYTYIPYLFFPAIANQ